MITPDDPADTALRILKRGKPTPKALPFKHLKEGETYTISQERWKSSHSCKISKKAENLNGTGMFVDFVRVVFDDDNKKPMTVTENDLLNHRCYFRYRL